MEYKPASKKESLRQVIRRTLSDRRRPGAATTLPNPLPNERFIFAKNRKPYYLESIAAFSLDFFGRVTLPSNKNCLLSLDYLPPDPMRFCSKRILPSSKVCLDSR